jgi:hypothetical protein
MPPGEEGFPENVLWLKEDVVFHIQPMIIVANL